MVNDNAIALTGIERISNFSRYDDRQTHDCLLHGAMDRAITGAVAVVISIDWVIWR